MSEPPRGGVGAVGPTAKKGVTWGQFEDRANPALLYLGRSEGQHILQDIDTGKSADPKHDTCRHVDTVWDPSGRHDPHS